jgi:hypothetical protein
LIPTSFITRFEGYSNLLMLIETTSLIKTQNPSTLESGSSHEKLEISLECKMESNERKEKGKKY